MGGCVSANNSQQKKINEQLARITEKEKQLDTMLNRYSEIIQKNERTTPVTTSIQGKQVDTQVHQQIISSPPVSSPSTKSITAKPITNSSNAGVTTAHGSPPRTNLSSHHQNVATSAQDLNLQQNTPAIITTAAIHLEIEQFHQELQSQSSQQHLQQSSQAYQTLIDQRFQQLERSIQRLNEEFLRSSQAVPDSNFNSAVSVAANIISPNPITQTQPQYLTPIVIPPVQQETNTLENTAKQQQQQQQIPFVQIPNEVKEVVKENDQKNQDESSLHLPSNPNIGQQGENPADVQQQWNEIFKGLDDYSAINIENIDTPIQTKQKKKSHPIPSEDVIGEYFGKNSTQNQGPQVKQVSIDLSQFQLQQPSSLSQQTKPQIPSTKLSGVPQQKNIKAGVDSTAVKEQPAETNKLQPQKQKQSGQGKKREISQQTFPTKFPQSSLSAPEEAIGNQRPKTSNAILKSIFDANPQLSEVHDRVCKAILRNNNE